MILAGLGSDKTPKMDKEALKAARAFGYTGEITPDDNVFAVWPENWEAVKLAVGMSTQWRISPTGKRIGLDYVALPIVENQLDLKPDERRFFYLQIIEAEIINAGNG